MKTKSKMNYKTDWVYNPAPESADHVRIQERYDLFINGKFIPSVKNAYFKTINPANENKFMEEYISGDITTIGDDEW